MDPLDQVGVPNRSSPSDQRPTQGLGHASAAPGYGHVPFADPNASHAGQPGPMRTQARRDVFWSNVVREILMALASAAASSSGRLGIGPAAAQASSSPVDELFDGRMGVITSLGQRIPIADITPVFACSMASCPEDRSISGDVQCTIFRINTPTGESYTLPISQIIGVHSVSESLLDHLSENEASPATEENRVPFGFAAYTSLARSEAEAREREQAQEPSTDASDP